MRTLIKTSIKNWPLTLLYLFLATTPILAQRATFLGQNASGFAIATLVQSNQCQFSGAIQESCAFGSPVTAGDTVVVIIYWLTATSTITSVVDSISPTATTYTNTPWATSATNCQGLGADTRVDYDANNPGGTGSNTIVVNFSATSSPGAIKLYEVHNAPLTTPIDVADCQYQNGGGGGVTAQTSPSITTTQKDLVLGDSSNYAGSGQTWSATSPFTILGSAGPGIDYAQEMYTQSSPGAINAAFTTTSATFGGTAVVAVK